MAKRENPKPAQIREARGFLRKKGMSDVFSPRAFAAAAIEINQGLPETLRYLAHLQAAGQGEAPFSQTAEALRSTASASRPVTVNVNR